MACSMEAPSVQLPEQPAANNAAQGYKWWELLQTGLATPTSQQQQQEEPPAEGSGSQPVSSVIEAALQAALSDSQWSSSGIPQLLRKALRQSCPEGARKSALALLDFHLLVEKYRNVVSKSSSGGSSGSGSRQEDGSSLGAEVQSPAKRARGPPPHEGESTFAATPAAPAAPPIGAAGSGTFALPAKPAPRAVVAPALPGAMAAPGSKWQPAGRTKAQAGSLADGNGSAALAASAKRKREVRVVHDPVDWQGRVVQTVHGRGVTYCDNLRIGLPFDHAAYAPQGPLEVTHIAPRRGIKLGDHAICRCSLPAALSRSQTAKLKQLASHELVLVVPLERHGLILVPYLDSAGALKLVGFFIVE